MSYYTRVDLQFSDEAPPVEEVAKIALSWLGAQGYAAEPVVADLLRGWEQGQTDFSDIMSGDLEGLMITISAVFPDVVFYVRGMGEEFQDVWLRKFTGGKTIMSIGPFESGEP